MPDLYFWVNGQVVTQEWDDDDKLFDDTYCVDTVEHPRLYYGMWDTTRKSAWREIPTTQFPPEFRAALLLLGVPT
jgi:hypothetical protein